MKKVIVILWMVIMLVTLCACTEKNVESDQIDLSKTENMTRVVTDALGRKVEIPHTVNRIVPLGNTPRMVAYLGLADKVVGISGLNADKITPMTVYAYVHRDKWGTLPSVGTDAMGNTDYYPEVILSVAPDVILCTYPEDMVNDIEEKTGIPVVAVGQGTLFGDDYDQALRILGETCGAEDRAEEIIEYLDNCLNDLNQRTSEIPDSEKPTVLSAAATFKGAHGIEGVRLSDPILTAVNADNVAFESAVGEAESAEVDKEQILEWDPEYIFCDYGGVGLVQQDMKKNSDFYARLEAYQNHQIYQYPSSTSYFSNVEISLANCYFVGSVLYPEQFEDVDVEKKANEIIRFFLGTDDYLSVLKDYGAGYGLVEIGE